jgi:hypothetical protein
MAKPFGYGFCLKKNPGANRQDFNKEQRKRTDSITFRQV